MIASCPNCSTHMTIHSPGEYSCVSCHAPFQVGGVTQVPRSNTSISDRLKKDDRSASSWPALVLLVGGLAAIGAFSIAALLPEAPKTREQVKKEQYAKLVEKQRAASEAQIAVATSNDNTDQFLAALAMAPGASNLVSHVNVVGNEITLTVTPAWHFQPKSIRQDIAASLWQTWANIASPSNLDQARITFETPQGTWVGGSGMLAGSLVSVSDE